MFNDELKPYLWQNIKVIGDYIGFDWSDHLMLGVYSPSLPLIYKCNHLSLIDYCNQFEIDYQETSFNHFACGHYYAIMIDCNGLSEEKQELILDFIAAIGTYAIYDDQKYSELEQELISENWDKFTAKDFLEYCLQDHSVELWLDCIFDELDQDNLWKLYRLYCKEDNHYPYAETCELVNYELKYAGNWFSFAKLLQCYPEIEESILQGYLDNYGYESSLQYFKSEFCIKLSQVTSRFKQMIDYYCKFINIVDYLDCNNDREFAIKIADYVYLEDLIKYGIS